MTSFCTHLDDRRLIEVTGPAASGFLQALLTCDVDKVKTGHSAFGALLTPQGKILFDIFLVETDDGFLLDARAGITQALIKRLRFYKLRAEVNFAPRDDFLVYAIWGHDAKDGIPDARLAAVGRRLYAPAFATNARMIEYTAHRVACGVPEAELDYPLGDTFPHDANFDLLNGVDFTKGCYIGQEVVSRMQHKAEIRKRIIPFTLSGVPDIAKTIMADDMALGTLGTVTSNHALGSVRLDRLRDALRAGKTLRSGDAVLKPFQPTWADFAL